MAGRRKKHSDNEVIDIEQFWSFVSARKWW